LKTLKPENVEVDFIRADKIEEQEVEESEVDEMWSFVGNKGNQRWLWHALDRSSGQVLAYVFGSRKDEVFLELKKLLLPFGIQKYCTDGWGAYERHIPTEQHEVGKRKTQRIERRHLSLRTRIKRLTRKTICYSRTEEMHDIVIGMFINRYEFGVTI
jgi:insertion element IS1 protein InsB